MAGAFEQAFAMAKSLSGGTMVSGSKSVSVAVSYGYTYDRQMLDAGYSPEKMFSVLVKTEDLDGWLLVPRKTAVVITSSTINGTFLIANVAQQNPVITYLILQNQQI